MFLPQCSHAQRQLKSNFVAFVYSNCRQQWLGIDQRYQVGKQATFKGKLLDLGNTLASSCVMCEALNIEK